MIFEICVYSGQALEEAPWGPGIESGLNSPEETNTLSFIKVID